MENFLFFCVFINKHTHNANAVDKINESLHHLMNLACAFSSVETMMMKFSLSFAAIFNRIYEMMEIIIKINLKLLGQERIQGWILGLKSLPFWEIFQFARVFKKIPKPL